MNLRRPLQSGWVLLLGGAALIAAGCESRTAPPPALPELASPLPGPPPEPEPAVIEDGELSFLSEDGEPVTEVDQSTTFRAIFRFRLIKPPTDGLQSVGVHLVTYIRGEPVIAWESVGPPIPEGEDRYRYEAELNSPTVTGTLHVQVDLGDKKVHLEEPILIRKK